MNFYELREALCELTDEQLKVEVSVLTLLPDEEFSLQNVTSTVLASEVPVEIQDDLNVALDDEDIPLLVIDQRN
jgi:hypothetical protein